MDMAEGYLESEVFNENKYNRNQKGSCGLVFCDIHQPLAFFQKDIRSKKNFGLIDIEIICSV